jgi:hypothetical protein
MILKQLAKVGMILLTSTLLLPPQSLGAKGDISSPASRSNSACRLISAKQMHQLFGGEWAEPTPIPVKAGLFHSHGVTDMVESQLQSY